MCTESIVYVMTTWTIIPNYVVRTNVKLTFFLLFCSLQWMSKLFESGLCFLALGSSSDIVLTIYLVVVEIPIPVRKQFKLTRRIKCLDNAGKWRGYCISLDLDLGRRSPSVVLHTDRMAGIVFVTAHFHTSPGYQLPK